MKKLCDKSDTEHLPSESCISVKGRKELGRILGCGLLFCSGTVEVHQMGCVACGSLWFDKPDAIRFSCLILLQKANMLPSHPQTDPSKVMQDTAGKMLLAVVSMY